MIGVAKLGQGNVIKVYGSFYSTVVCLNPFSFISKNVQNMNISLTCCALFSMNFVTMFFNIFWNFRFSSLQGKKSLRNLQTDSGLISNSILCAIAIFPWK